MARSVANAADPDLYEADFHLWTEPRHGWEATVLAQRIQLRRRLTISLRNHVAAVLAELYAEARELAAHDLKQDSVPADRLPADCPYTLDQVLGPDWLPANVDGPAGS